MLQATLWRLGCLEACRFRLAHQPSFQVLERDDANSPQVIPMTVPAGTKTITTRSYCNLHGNWRSPTYAFAVAQCTSDDVDAIPQIGPDCGAGECERDTTPAAYTAAVNGGWATGVVAQHIPNISQSGNIITVTVPHGEKDGSVHALGAIWVKNQNGDLVYCSHRPHTARVNMTAVVITFPVPDGTTSIVAYTWCTIHGTWVSDPFIVEVLMAKIASLPQVPADSGILFYTRDNLGPWTGQADSHVPKVINATATTVVVKVRMLWPSFPLLTNGILPFQRLGWHLLTALPPFANRWPTRKAMPTGLAPCGSTTSGESRLAFKRFHMVVLPTLAPKRPRSQFQPTRCR